MAQKRSLREAKRQRLADREKRQLHGLDHQMAPLIVSGIFLLHFVGLAALFAPLPGLVNNQPIIEQDWGLHFHHLNSMEMFWTQDRTVWGYNPLFMAGYPSNTIQDLSIKLFELSALGLSSLALSPIQWFKILAVLAMACIPWLMYFTVRNFFHGDELKNLAALSAAGLGTVYWWNSLPREMFFYGMIGYVFASYLSVLGVSLFYRMAKQTSSWSPAHLGWFLFALAILPTHVQAVLMILPPLVALLVIRPDLIRREVFLWLGAAAILSALINLIWIAPAFSHRGADVSAAIVEQLPLFTSREIFTFVYDYLGPRNFWTFRSSFWEKGFRLVLLVLGFLGTWSLLRTKNRDLGLTLAAAIAVLFMVAYFGSFIPLLEKWQSLRFKVPYDLFLVLPAAYFIAVRLADRSSSYGVAVLLSVGAVAFIVNLVQTETQGRMKLRTRIIPEISAIVEWVQKETPANARVLFEESGDETGFAYDGMYLSSFLPHWTGRQLIGGPINLYNDRHHFAEFHSGKLFKRDIQTLTDEEIKNYLSLYNIGAVIAFHPASIERFRSIPGLLVLDERIGPIHLMKVNQPFMWFLQGEGQLKTSQNRIQASDVRGREVILKYHWAEGLISTPDVKMVPMKIDPDPIPFIKVLDPPATFTLRIR
ncbi:MAG TPA: hypothetical protein VFU31_29680 [Candidatus Binatia bacterium]|nr:hypothetical protein [Candidatus Binatia bacterium]